MPDTLQAPKICAVVHTSLLHKVHIVSVVILYLLRLAGDGRLISWFRLETHLIHNKFINNSKQKGCMEKIPGCWEHLSMVWHALKEERARKSNLAVIWLDIANAYGSIPHKLIVFALHRYGVSPQWIRLIETYYKGIFSKSFSQSATSSWHRHQQ